MGDNKQDAILRRAFGEERHEQFRQFMITVWKSRFKYKVLMARRAFNLHYAYLNSLDADELEEYQLDGIMSNTAILFKAGELAAYYMKNGSFPGIMIVDDVLLHGRGILNVIHNLESLIITFVLENKKNDQEFCEADIHRQLMKAILVYVFAKNSEKILFSSENRYFAENVMDICELRGLSQEISNALQVCSVANTSYVLSGELAEKDYRLLLTDNNYLKGSDQFKYRGNSQILYMRKYKGILETIRVNKPTQFPDGGDIVNSVTSLVVFDDLDRKDFNLICNWIATELEIIAPYNQVSKLLRENQDKDQLVKPRAQLLSFLLSVKSFVDFYRTRISDSDSRLSRFIYQSDYVKIASNFAGKGELEYDFLRIIRSICNNYSFCKKVEDILVEEIAYLTRESSIGELKLSRTDALTRVQFPKLNQESAPFEFAEDLFYEIGINAEYDVNLYKEGKKKYDTKRTGKDIVELNLYLSYMHRKEVEDSTSMGCMLSLMDSGLFSMNVENRNNKIKCVLKAGEMSTFVLPRRFAEFIPALAMVERGYRLKSSEPQKAVSSFINYLQKYCDNLHLTGDTRSFPMVDKLQKSKANLLYIYRVGQSFQGWDTDLVTIGDRLAQIEDDEKRSSYNAYRTNLDAESQRKSFYRYCASSYLHSDVY